MFEIIFFKEISNLFANFLSEQQWGFKNGYSMQHWLLNLYERRQNKNEKFLLTNFSKASDCLQYELLTEKLNVYGFNLPVTENNNKNW